MYVIGARICSVKPSLCTIVQILNSQHYIIMQYSISTKNPHQIQHPILRVHHTKEQFSKLNSLWILNTQEREGEGRGTPVTSQHYNNIIQPKIYQVIHDIACIK